MFEYIKVDMTHDVEVTGDCDYIADFAMLQEIAEKKIRSVQYSGVAIYTSNEINNWKVAATLREDSDSLESIFLDGKFGEVVSACGRYL